MYFEYLLVMAPTGQTARQSPQNSHSSALSPFATTCVTPSFLKNCKASIIWTSLQMLMHSPHRMHRFMLKSSTRLRRSSGSPLGFGLTRFVTPCCERHILKLAVPVGIADRTVQRMDGEMFFHRLFPGRKQIVPFSPHDKTGFRLGGAGAHRRLFAFHHDQDTFRRIRTDRTCSDSTWPARSCRSEKSRRTARPRPLPARGSPSMVNSIVGASTSGVVTGFKAISLHNRVTVLSTCR